MARKTTVVFTAQNLEQQDNLTAAIASLGVEYSITDSFNVPDAEIPANADTQEPATEAAA